MRRFALLLLVLLGVLWSAASAGATVLTIHCAYSNSAQVDPIVSPGAMLSAHMHDFFGSKAVDQNSTADTLLGTAHTCKTPGDTAGYWFPQPRWNGTPILSNQLGEYWKKPKGIFVNTPPHGMAVVAGDSHATNAAGNPHVSWTCGNGVDKAAPWDCTNSTGGSHDVTAVIDFPNCWDGHTAFDIHAGISDAHFAYASGTKPCPAGFPVRLSQLTTHIHFVRNGGQDVINPFNPDGSLALSFSSGPYYTYHGDFLNGYDQPIFVGLIEGCLDGKQACPPHG